MKRVPYDGEGLTLDFGSETIYYPRSARPHIQANHIDGPLLYSRDGRMHWISLWERFLFWLGQTDAGRLERKYWDKA